MKPSRRTDTPADLRQRTPDHHGAHTPIEYAKANRILLPGEKAVECVHLNWKPTDKEFEETSDKDYISDPLFENCVLPGEWFPIRWNYQHQQLEPVGSRGLIRDVRCVEVIQDQSLGNAVLIDSAGSDVTDGEIEINNDTGRTLNADDVVEVQYHNSPSDDRLWKTTNAGKGSGVRVVRLEQTGGNNGSPNSEPSWTYNVRDWYTGSVLASDVNPGIPPHEHYRKIGRRDPATIGIQKKDGPDWIFIFVNEAREFDPCSDKSKFRMIYDEPSSLGQGQGEGE